MQHTTVNYETQFLREMIRRRGAMADDLKGVIEGLLRSCTSDACKMVSKLVAFSWEIYKAKDEWGSREQLLAFFKDFNNFKPLNTTTPLEIV